MDESALTEKQTEVVNTLREGRANPQYLKEQTSIDHRNTVQYHLRNLCASGHVRKVTKGLYELADESRTSAADDR